LFNGNYSAIGIPTLRDWQKGFQLKKKYGLRSQICRSAVSKPSKIAEGCSRNRQIDFKRFLEIALGSSFDWKLN